MPVAVNIKLSKKPRHGMREINDVIIPRIRAPSIVAGSTAQSSFNHLIKLVPKYELRATQPQRMHKRYTRIIKIPIGLRHIEIINITATIGTVIMVNKPAPQAAGRFDPIADVILVVGVLNR